MELDGYVDIVVFSISFLGLVGWFDVFLSFFLSFSLSLSLSLSRVTYCRPCLRKGWRLVVQIVVVGFFWVVHVKSIVIHPWMACLVVHIIHTS